MNIIIESHIPYIGDTLDDLGSVRRLAPEEFTPEAVADADALIVRTRTRCDASLLSGSKVRFVATATIGTDHIDLPWCAANGITTVSAPGCNAPAVAQYVWASLLRLLPSVEGKTIGIVGLGHVGSIVAAWGFRLGVRVLACDPPRQRRDGGWNTVSPYEAGGEPFVSLAHIAREADIITFHTPLIRSGEDCTFHMASRDLFRSLLRKPIIINAARGAVADNAALVEALKEGLVSAAVMDCWEGEPSISPELLELAAVATPHIAGYSIEGKQRASAACIAALRRFAGQEAVDAVGEMPAASTCTDAQDVDPALFGQRILASYDPFADTERLRADKSSFETLRNNYLLRHEVWTSRHPRLKD